MVIEKRDFPLQGVHIRKINIEDFQKNCVWSDYESPAVCQLQFVPILIDANLMHVTIPNVIQSNGGR